LSSLRRALGPSDDQDWNADAAASTMEPMFLSMPARYSEPGTSATPLNAVSRITVTEQWFR
jgi:hypothetical protein